MSIPIYIGVVTVLVMQYRVSLMSTSMHMTGGIQESGIDFLNEKSPIVHRRTLETLAVLTVPSALSPDDENTRTTMSTALTRLLSTYA